MKNLACGNTTSSFQQSRTASRAVRGAAGVVSLCWVLAGCVDMLDPAGSAEVGLGLSQRSGGPRVVWDALHRPLPELPLPNDAATRLDPTSATGRRLNISTAAAVTDYERRTRKLFDQLDGFGSYGPISVRFDQPLDLADLATRHQANDDFRDDAIFLLNVDRRCERFGEEIALDLGRGRFPVTLLSRSQRTADPLAPGGYLLDEGDNKLFPFDPEGESLTVAHNQWNEDKNGNGKLDPGEDRDADGVLDIPDFVDPHACDSLEIGTLAYDRCVADHIAPWYERATNTLTVRPVWPLQERCVHAVVLTKRLRGASGKPVESPFPAVQPRDQVQALQPVAELLGRYGLTKSDVAFAWSYTVGTMTEDLLTVREGLYGAGPLKRLAQEFPVSGWKAWTRDEWRKLGGIPELGADKGGSQQLLQGGCAAAMYADLAGTGDGDQQICGGYADFASIGGILAGTFRAPNLLADKDGDATAMYPADEDETWQLQAHRGIASYGKTEVTFWCALPRKEQKPASVQCKPGNPDAQPWCAPYPVVFYTHGYGGFKGEFLLHAGRHAQMGVAGCGIDSYGHGRATVLDKTCPGALEYGLAKAQFAKWGMPEFLTMMFYGRDRDLNNDGCGDGGADQWTANLFHTRDIVRQSVLEEMQFVRMLRAMDGKNKDEAGRILGDVDGDGQPDLGGPQNAVTAWGISLGGQLTGVLAGADPSMDAVSPDAVGAGLTDISVRLGEGGLAEAVMLPVQGPLMVGCLPTDAHQNPLKNGSNSGPCLPKTGKDGGAAGGPQQAGDLLLAWYAHDNAKLAVRPIARVPGVQVGDRVEVHNLTKQLVRKVTVNARGWLRANIAADAKSPIQRRKLLGLHDGDHDPVKWDDTPALGDRIEVRVFAGDTDQRRGTAATWQWETTFQGTTYPAGRPLVALQEGLGYPRNSPDFRRFYSIAAHAIAPADPAVWAPRYFANQARAPYDPAWKAGRNHVLVMPTVGDTQVPTATGVALGRAAGLLGSWQREPDKYKPEHGWRQLFTPDPKLGMSVEEWLRQKWVIEGDARLQRWAGYTYNPSVLFDPENISEGKAAFTCQPGGDEWSQGEFLCPADSASKPPFGVPHPDAGQQLRQIRPRGDGTYDAWRLPLLRPAGQHGIYNPQPFRAFDADAYMVNYTARYLASRGKAVSDQPGCDCSYVTRPVFQRNGQPVSPGLEDVAVCPDDKPAYGKPCSATCAAGWGLGAVPKVLCEVP